MSDIVQKHHDDVQKNALSRIQSLIRNLERIKSKIVEGKGNLNPLGEIQAEACMLDCRLATLAELRWILDDIKREKVLDNS